MFRKLSSFVFAIYLIVIAFFLIYKKGNFEMNFVLNLDFAGQVAYATCCSDHRNAVWMQNLQKQYSASYIHVLNVSYFQVMKEVQSALNTAAADDSKLVLLSAVGSVFCCGLDFIYFIRRLTDDRKRESTKMADAIRFV